MEPEDLHIVTPTAEDLPLAEAARLAGVGAATIRRALATGDLPRRYALGPHGPHLVFWRGDIERWRERPERRRGRPTAEAQRLGDHRMRSRGGGGNAREHLRTLAAGGEVPPEVVALLEEIAADWDALQAKIDRLRALIAERAPA